MCLDDRISVPLLTSYHSPSPQADNRLFGTSAVREGDNDSGHITERDLQSGEAAKGKAEVDLSVVKFLHVTLDPLRLVRLLQELDLIRAQLDLECSNQVVQVGLLRHSNDGRRDVLLRVLPSQRNLRHRTALLLRELVHTINDLFFSLRGLCQRRVERVGLGAHGDAVLLSGKSAASQG